MIHLVLKEFLCSFFAIRYFCLFSYVEHLVMDQSFVRGIPVSSACMSIICHRSGSPLCLLWLYTCIWHKYKVKELFSETSSTLGSFQASRVCPLVGTKSRWRWVWGISGMIMTGKNRDIRWKNPVPVPLYPPQISHILAWHRTRVSAVRSQRLTVWTMALPSNVINVTFFCPLFVPRHGGT